MGNDNGGIRMLTTILTILTVLGGGSTLGFFLKYKKYANVLKEIVEVVKAIQEGYSDKKLTKEEYEKIWKELQDVIAAAIAIIK
jgi:hypothetical protein